MTTVLQRAILAMDAYNRGLTPGIQMFSNKIAGVTLKPVGNDGPAYSEDFSATTYRLDGISNEYVIAYRGTDDFALDILTGYSSAIGGLDEQAINAIRFYKASLQMIAGEPTTSSTVATVSTTGHSLGGGLAGVVSSLYNLNSTIFNNMTFQQAATNYHSEAINAGTSDATSFSQILKDLIYGDEPITDTYNNNPITYTNYNDPLRITRNSQTNVKIVLDGGDGPWLTSPLLGHSMATQVALIYADQNSLTEWMPASSYMWNAFNSDDAANNVQGLQTLNGASGLSDKMKTLIAYSAIDPDLSSADKPYGDTGIASMFDDAADMSIAVLGRANSAFTRSASHIANLAMVNAGNLAFSAVESTAAPNATEGVLASDVNTSRLSVDFTATRWGIASRLAPEELKASIIGTGLGTVERANDFTYALTAFGQPAVNYTAVQSVSYQTNVGSVEAGPTIPIGSVELLFLSEDASSIDTSNGPASTIRAIASSFDGNQTITGHDEDDIFIGGTGNNILMGGGGRNALFGREGDDIIVTGGNGDIVNGGAGNDLIKLLSGSIATVEFGVGDGQDVVRYAAGQGGYNLKLEDLSFNDISIIVGGSDNSYQAYGDISSQNIQFLVFKINTTGDTITFAQHGDDIGTESSTSYQKNGLTYAALQNPISSVIFKDGVIWSAIDLWSHIENHSSYGNITSHMMTASERKQGYAFAGPRAKNAKFLHDINEQYFVADPVKPVSRSYTDTPSSDYITDDGGDDFIIVSGGDDTVTLSAGNDTVSWMAGAGNASIVTTGDYNGSDLINLDAGIAASALTFNVNNYGDIILTVAGSTGSLKLDGQYFSDVGNGDVSIGLSDGTIISHGQLIAAAAASLPANYQTILGTDGDDWESLPGFNFSYSGLKGDDIISAGQVAGGSEIRFLSGDGNDTFTGYRGRQDVLYLMDSMPQDVTLSIVPPTGWFAIDPVLMITLKDGGGTFAVEDQFPSDTSHAPGGLHSIRFSDGTVWDRAQIASVAGPPSGPTFPPVLPQLPFTDLPMLDASASNFNDTTIMLASRQIVEAISSFNTGLGVIESSHFNFDSYQPIFNTSHVIVSHY